MSNLYTVYRNAIKALDCAGCDSPETDARILVEHCFSMNRTQLLLNMQSKADETKLSYFNDCVSRRCSFEPLQYIIGEWDFYKYTFKVKEGVLIPRPETELLVEYAVNNMRKTYKGVIFDLCTGSGCVGISVAKHFPMCSVFCVDISDTAVSLAKENAATLDAPNVTVIKGDICDGIESLKLPQPDMILSNPPYIATEELAALQKEVRFEPSLALDGGIDGLKFYRALSEKWFPYLTKGGTAAMECGEGQAKNILSMFLNKADGAKLIKDGAGTDRVVVVRR